jgi:hypothetical protein
MNRLGPMLLVLITLMSPAAAAAVTPDTQVGNFLFKMPNGWNPVAKGDVTIIYAPAPPPGTTTYIALAADPLDGDLTKSFGELWTGFTNSYQILQGGQTMPLHTAGYDAYYTNAIARDRNGTLWTVYLMGAQYHKRIQTVMFMSNVQAGTMLSAYDQVFQQTFLASLSFGDALPGAKIPPIAGPVPAETPHKLPAGALEGIYVAFALDASGNGSAKSLLFSQDGWVVKNIPGEGMIGFDFTANRNDPNTNRSWVGRYQVNGNQITILWQDYPNDRQVITRNESSANPGIDVYVPMCRCTGKKFSGTYDWGVAGGDQYLQFFADGTFIDHKTLDQMIVPSAFYSNPRIQQGTYSIQSQTMIFTFADGRRAMRTFYAPKAQEHSQTFGWIDLGGHSLYPAHRQNQP